MLCGVRLLCNDETSVVHEKAQNSIALLTNYVIWSILQECANAIHVQKTFNNAFKICERLKYYLTNRTWIQEENWFSTALYPVSESKDRIALYVLFKAAINSSMK